MNLHNFKSMFFSNLSVLWSNFPCMSLPNLDMKDTLLERVNLDIAIA